MQPKSKHANYQHFDRKNFLKTAHPLHKNESENEEASWIRTCSYVSLIPIFILLIIVLTICSAFIPRERIFFKAKQPPVKCTLHLVESLPDGLNYSKTEPHFMSTYDAWNTLLDAAQNTVDIGSFYWTLRGADVINHTTAAAGEAIFKRLLANGNATENKLDIRIAQSYPTKDEPNLDTILLEKHDAAIVRSVNFPKLLGGGVLHTKLWIIDNEHFYLGSANMDWRSLTQVKELGVLGQNCGRLTADLMKIFKAYWYLGANTTTKIPNPWPIEYATQYNMKNPMIVDYNEQKFRMATYFSSSPPPLTGLGRTNDIDAIVNTILSAKNFVHIAVMDYFPLLIYTRKLQYWPYIDDALRKAAIENGVKVKLLISWWKHSRPSEDYFLRSLASLTDVTNDVNIEIKRFIVPADDDQDKIPFGRVNHNKYMVTDNIAYIGTSNWSGDYFTNTAGIGLIMRELLNANSNQMDGEMELETTSPTTPTIRDELSRLFLRDWNSPYAVPLK